MSLTHGTHAHARAHSRLGKRTGLSCTVYTSADLTISAALRRPRAWPDMYRAHGPHTHDCARSRLGPRAGLSCTVYTSADLTISAALWRPRAWPHMYRTRGPLTPAHPRLRLGQRTHRTCTVYTSAEWPSQRRYGASYVATDIAHARDTRAPGLSSSRWPYACRHVPVRQAWNVTLLARPGV